MIENWNYEVAVKEIKVADQFGNLIHNRLATTDVKTGEVLGLVNKRYRLIQNKTLYDVMQDVGKDIGLELQRVSVCKHKSITVFKYGFGEKHQTEIKNSIEKEDRVQFGIEVLNSFNSYNGVPTGGIRAFATRLVCTNGMVIPKVVGRFSFRNLSSIEPQDIKDELTNRLQPILNTANTWEEWAKFTPSRIKIGQFVSGHLGKKSSEQILLDYDNGRDRTLWGLYNLLTYYITHVAKTKNVDNLRLKQWELEKVVDKLYKIDLK